jgi:hypothetical protein
MLAEGTAADGDAGRTHAHGTGNGRSGDDVAFVRYTPGASRGRLLCLADARRLPLKVQAQAFVNGVIPYIPALGRDGTTRRLEAR